MSDRPESEAAGPEAEEEAFAEDPRDDDAMRALLKRSMSRDAEDAPDLLAGVQRRIRARSRGKFFADGWSTQQARFSYVLVGLLTLLLVALAYFALSPFDIR
jgi:hypothetical protein